MSIQHISLDQIKEDPNQPRVLFSPHAMKSLRASIKRFGMVTPITVTWDGDSFTILDGARRFRAAKANKMDKVPATVVNIPDDQRIDAQVAANSNRAGHTTFELANLINTHLAGHKMTPAQIQKWFRDQGYEITKDQIKYAKSYTELPPWALKLAQNDALTPEFCHWLNAQIKTAPRTLQTALKDAVNEQISPISPTVGIRNKDRITWMITKDWFNLKNTQEWQPKDRRVLFDWKTCRKCPSFQKFDNTPFCRNKAGFEEKNSLARAQLNAKKASDPEAIKDEVQAQQDKQERSVENRLRAHLYEHCLQAIKDRICSSGKTDYGLGQDLLIMAVTRRFSDNWQINVSHELQPCQVVMDSSPDPDGAAFRAAMAYVLNRMNDYHIIALAKKIVPAGDLRLVWQPNEDYLKIFRKSDLENRAKEWDVPDCFGRPKAKMIESFLKHSDRWTQPEDLLFYWNESHQQVQDEFTNLTELLEEPTE
jgi:hypothetical protein